MGPFLVYLNALVCALAVAGFVDTHRPVSAFVASFMALSTLFVIGMVNREP